MPNKRHIIWFAGIATIAMGLLTVALIYGFRDHIFPLPPLEEIRQSAHTLLQSIPAPLYFAALVFLPATGFPLTLFYLTALPVLGTVHPVIGIGLVWLALTLNMILTRWLTHGIFLPLIQWAIRHRNLTIPKLHPGNEWQIVVAMRISPLPWALQNYVLSLGHARWRTYLWLSLPIQGGIGLAMMLVGESVLSGGLGYLLLAACLLLIVTLLLQSLRKRLTRAPVDPAS